MTNPNPQASQMADESMLRTLAAQVRCIWPQEQALFARYGAPQRILDVGCGTGEFMVCLANRYPEAEIIGIELHPAHVERARARCARFGDRIQAKQGDAFQLNLPEQSFDLVVCRHVLQAVPQPEKIISECKRVLKPKGWIHLLLEDYTMIHMDGAPRLDHFWLNGPVRFGQDTGCDLRIGRRGLSLLCGFTARQLDFVSVDTDRVSRDDFADIFTAWRDGYSTVLAPYLGWPVHEVISTWDEMISIIRTRYALWQVPIASGQLC